MDELPTDPRAQSFAILNLEARMHVLRTIVSILVADNAPAINGVKSLSAALAGGAMLGELVTDAQIEQMGAEVGAVLASVDRIHKGLGIDPEAKRAAPTGGTPEELAHSYFATP